MEKTENQKTTDAAIDSTQDCHMSMTFLLTVPWSLPTNTCEYEDQPQSPRGLALFGR